MDCLFCKIANGEIPAKICYKDDLIVAFEDINPQAPVHTLIIPRQHIEKVTDLGEGNSGLIGKMALVAKKIAKDKGLDEQGFRLVLNCGKDAGQLVLHVHMHLLAGRKFNWPPG